MKTDIQSEVGTHVFERAGLGKAPFRFVGFSVNIITYPDGTQKAGSSCDYCGTGIANECHVRSSDGKTFKVGCDCIRKADDNGLLKAYATHPDVRKHKRDLEANKAAAVWNELKPLIEANRAALESQPHPRGFTDFKTGKLKTRYDDVMFWFGSGRKGRKDLLATLKNEFPG